MLKSLLVSIPTSLAPLTPSLPFFSLLIYLVPFHHFKNLPLCPFGLVFCLFCSLYDLGYFPFAILIGFSVFGLVGTDFQVVYVDGCLCICLIVLFHGISFWHFRFCFAMQDMKLPSWGMTSFATADFFVLLSVIDNFSESFFLEFEPCWLNLSTCWMLIKHVNLNSYNH